MNELKDKDIREALRRREQQRKKPQVPSNFCDKVMQEIEPKKRKKETLVVVLLSIAASVAILFMLIPVNWNIQQKQTETSVIHKQFPSQSITQAVNQNEMLAIPKEDEKSDKRLLTKKEIRQSNNKFSPKADIIKNQDVEEIQNAHLTNVDSLDYYIDKIERELAQVDESLYIERMNKVIQADERLQRIVNKYILERINNEDKPQAAHTINPQTINNHEE